MNANKRGFWDRFLLVVALCLGAGGAGAQTPPESLTVSNQIAISGETAVFAVSVTGSGPLSYRWLHDGLPVNLITTVAGNYDLGGSYSGDNGLATNAGLYHPHGIFLDAAGGYYIADTYNNVIRRVDASGIITTVAGNFSLGAAAYSGDGGAAVDAGLNEPSGVFADGSGNLYIADSGNNVVRKVDAAGIISTVAGNRALGAGAYSGDGGPATSAALWHPTDVTVDEAGYLYIADAGNNLVRRVDPAGVITTVAGNYHLGSGAYSGDGGPATNAALNLPAGVALDGAGDLYIADRGNSVVRRVDTNGIITTVAGNYGLSGIGGCYEGDGGLATDACLSYPYGVNLDGLGDFYIADTTNNVIRKVDDNGIIATLAGDNNLGGNYLGDGGSATNAGLWHPSGVVFDGLGNLYFADTYNNVIRKVAGASFKTTSPTNALTIPGAQTDMAGDYQVIVSNPYGSITSSIVTLTVYAPPVILQQPTNQASVSGDAVEFAMVASGFPAPLYQWFFNGTNLLTGATNAVLMINNVQTNDQGSYLVEAFNLAGSVTSSNALLTVVTAPATEPGNQTGVQRNQVAFGSEISLLSSNPPVITVQPTNHTVVQGSNVTFTVTATNGVLYYQWWFNTNNVLAGQTNFTLTLTNVLATNAGRYFVVVTNSAGSVTSSNAILTVLVPPTISAQPTNQAVVQGSNTTFSVTAAGSTNLIYHWWFNGTNVLAGRTNSVLTLTNVVATNAGNYFVIVTNLAGSVTSSNGVLTVLTKPAISAQPTNFTAIQGSNATFSVTAAGGGLNYQWRFNTTNLLAGQTNSVLALTAVQTNNAGSYSVVITNRAGTVTSTNAVLTVLIPPSITVQPTNQTVVQGSNTTFSVSATGSTNLTYHWWFNATNQLAGRTNATLSLTNLVATNAGSYFVVITNFAGSVTSSSALLTLLTTPTITAQPANQTVVQGGSAAFSVAASGSGLNYQWRFNTTTVLAGQTNATLTLTNALAANAGNYSVVVTNLAGSVTSSNAVLTVLTPPVFTVQPANLTVVQNSNAIFSVSATGGGLNYQWWFAGTNVLAGQTNATLTLADVQPANAGSYFVVVTNLAGAATSSNGLLTVLLPPTIIAQPANQTVLQGSNTTFGVFVSGSTNLTYQWWFNATNVLAGRTNATLSLTNVVGANGGNYFVVVTNQAGSVTSSNALLTVIVPPTISAQPTNQTAVQGNNATFGVTAAGGGLNYQWWFGGTNALAGQTNSTLTLTSVVPANAGAYSVVVTNLAGSITSSNALLTVLIPPTITSQPANVTVLQGSNAVFSVTATGSINLAYQWWFNANTALAGRTNATFTLTNAAATNAGNYTVVVTNLAGSTTSSIAVLTVLVPPTISAQPTNQTVGQGGNAVFSVTAAGGGLNYQWRFSTTNMLAGQTNSVLTITNVLTSNAGNYSVVVTNLAGTVTSSNALLTVLPPPVIITQPANQTVVQGSNAVFSVSATNGTLSYQWWFNTTNVLAGRTSATLTLTNALAANAGNYFVVVTNSAGSVTSSIAVLTVLTPPIITQQPTNLEVNIGGTAVFNLTVTGATPFGYGWLFDGNPIAVTNVIITVAGNNIEGPPTNGAAVNAELRYPFGVAANGPGGFYIADYYYCDILQVNASGNLTRYAGVGGSGYSGNNGAATSAALDGPTGLAVDTSSNVYIVDSLNNVIRKVNTSGIITTIAGNHTSGYSGDGGVATNATLNNPFGVAVDGAGNVYISDAGNNVIRKVTPGGIITTFAGNHTSGYAGDGGAATLAEMDTPEGIAVDGAGSLYIADFYNEVIRKVSAGGIITTVAGNHGSGFGYAGDGGAATSAQVNGPYAVAVDASGNLYIGDFGNAVIRKVNAGGIISTVAGNHRAGYTGNGGASTNAELNGPIGVAVDAAGNLDIADYSNNVVRQVTLGALDGNGTVQNGQLTLTNVQPYMAGNYQVVISNPYGSTTSSNAVLTVANPPVITVQPVNQAVVQGSNATFSVTATGSTLSYQWWFNGTNRLAGQTNALLTLGNAGATNVGNYDVVITNIFGSVTSSNALLAEVLGNFTWVGGASTNWFNSTNWSPAGIPGIGDEVNILNGGTVSLATNALVGYLNLVSGAINGTGLLSVSNTFDWTGGSVYCPVLIRTNAVLILGGSGALSLYSVLTNAGTVDWAGTGAIQVYNGQNGGTGGFVNLAGAVFNIQNDELMNGHYGSEYFNNAGLVQKSPTTNTTTINLAFDNTGALEVESGTILLNDGGGLAGAILTASGATLDLSGGLFNWNGSLVFAGLGVVQTTGGSVVLTGTVTNVAPANVTISGVSNAVLTGTLSLTNCSVTGPVTVAGALTLSGGGINAGGALLVATNGTLGLEDGISLYGVLTNLGTVNWTGPNDLEVYNNGSINTGGIVNQEGAVFNAQNDQSMTGNEGYEYFNNAGLFVKSPTTGTTTMDVAFTNTVTGAVEVESGALVFADGGSLAGNFLAAAGTTNDFSGGNFALSGVFDAATNAVIDFTSGSYTWNGNPVFEGPGQVQISPGGTVVLTSAVTNVSFTNMTISGLNNLAGTANLTNCVINDQEIIAGTVNWSAGQFNAPETVAGTLNWSGGGQVDAFSSMMVASNGVLNITGPVTLDGVLDNAGTVNWTGTNDIEIYNDPYYYYYLSSGGITNEAGAVFNIENDQTIDQPVPFYPAYFENAGALVKSAGTNTTTINVFFDNFGGTVEAGSGTILFNNGGNLNGNFAAGAGGGIYFNGVTSGEFPTHNYNWNGTAVFTGPGPVQVVGGSVVIATTVTNVDFDGGTIYGLTNVVGTADLTNCTIGDAETVLGTLDWSGGEISSAGSLTVASNAVMNLTGDVSFSGPLTNAGTLNWIGAGDLTFHLGSAYGSYNNNAQLDNLLGAVFNIQNDQSMLVGYPGQLPIFNNEGTVLKTGGTNASTCALNFNDSGGVDIESGTIAFDAGGSFPNSLQVAADAAVFLSGGTFTEATACTNDFNINGGTLYGPWTVVGTFNWYGGAMACPVLTVADTGLLNLETNGAIAAALVVNNGTVQKSGGTGAASFGGFFNNVGTLSVETGSVALDGGAIVGGNLQVATNSGIYYNSGSFLETGTATIRGTGGVVLAGGTVTPLPLSIGLTNGNSTVRINPMSQKGMSSWVVDGTNQLAQHWFWLGAGTNAQNSVDQLGLLYDLSSSPTNLAMNYLGQGLVATVQFSLAGGTNGSYSSDLVEDITITNTTSVTNTFHLYSFSDFDLGGAAAGDTVSYPSTNQVVQVGKNMMATQTIDAPTTNEWESSWYAITMDKLIGGTPATLSDSSFPAGSGDQTFAYQWDFTLNPGQVFQASLTNSIRPNP